MNIKNKSLVTEQRWQFTHALTHIPELLHYSATYDLFDIRYARVVLKL
jgi:hypothetical protein